MSRVFLALPIGQNEKRAIGDLAAKLKSKFDDARWVEPANYHLTLFFIGEVSKSDIPSLAEAVSDVPPRFKPGTLEFGSLGFFGKPSFPRVLFLRADASRDDLTSFEKLASEIRAAAAGFGAPDDKKFAPHLTLARFARLRPGAPPSAANEKRLKEIGANRQGGLSEGKSETTPEWLVFEPVSCRIERVVLYESEFKGGGVKYSELNTWQLENQAGA